MSRACSLFAFLLIICGCETNAHNSGDSAAPTETAASAKDADGSLGAVIIDARLVPTRTAQGIPAQAVVTRWRNTGTKAIRAIDAEIIARDPTGSIVFSTNSYSIYATSDDTPGILPGKTYSAPADAGFILPPNGPTAANVEVRIVGVLESAGF